MRSFSEENYRNIQSLFTEKTGVPLRKRRVARAAPFVLAAAVLAALLTVTALAADLFSPLAGDELALGAVYDTPHGVANAILLPTVMAYNAEATGEKYREIAKAMGVKGVEKMSQAEYRKAACDAVAQLSKDVGIPQDLKNIVKAEDIPFLAQSAMDDACRPGNPKDPTLQDIIDLYKSLL